MKIKHQNPKIAHNQPEPLDPLLLICEPNEPNEP
jgi:hypothetical protein